MRVVNLAALCLCVPLLGACSGVAAVKSTLYSTGAKLGNRYCESKDPLLRDHLMGRVNSGLSQQGARFTLLGVACEDEPGLLLPG